MTGPKNVMRLKNVMAPDESDVVATSVSRTYRTCANRNSGRFPARARAQATAVRVVLAW